MEHAPDHQAGIWDRLVAWVNTSAGWAATTDVPAEQKTHSTGTEQNPFTQLPWELTLLIVSMLRAPDLCHFGATSTACSATVDVHEQHLWHIVFRRRWPSFRYILLPRSLLEDPDSQDVSWKLLYILNDQLLRSRLTDGGEEYKPYLVKVQQGVKGLFPLLVHGWDAAGAGDPQREVQPVGKPNVPGELRALTSTLFRTQLKRFTSSTGLTPLARITRCALRVLVTGEPGAGKSSLVMQYARKEFKSHPCLDLDVFRDTGQTFTSVSGIQVATRSHTLSRLPEYNDLMSIAVVIIAYDLSRGEDALSSVREWLATVQAESCGSVIAVAGLKADKRSRSLRSFRDVKSWLATLGAPLYFEVDCSKYAQTQNLLKATLAECLPYPELWSLPRFKNMA
eukprot:TRINITY_DN5265_c0_g1_i1.p1 TRINITY_DN5265_c0_g1~~TRINITY_DN5265_c0_g1_i1.p1  ORF type:complete len:404 (+),score=18.91 TRINITY_DN5265_c0_g1_i1:29-1213(+)